jgi:hypothetical protein
VGGPEHVADHAADPRVGAAERLDGGRVVVGLGLEGDRRALGERDDPCVADERGAHERGGDGLRGRPQQPEQVDDAVGRRDGGPERLVGAVLAPRLGQRLQLHIGGVATDRREVVPDGRELLGIEGERALDADAGQRRVVEPTQGHDLDAGRVVGAGVQLGLGGGRRPVLDDGVGDEPP